MNQHKINEFLNSDHVISIDKGVTLKRTYTTDIQKIIENGRASENYQGTELAWIDLETLKKFVSILEEVGNQNGTAVSGVRIYFAEYPKNGNYTPDEIERLLPGRETIFFVPTIEVTPTDLSKKYPILHHKPFSIVPDGENPIKGTLKVINDLEVDVEKSGSGNTLTNETSLLFNNFYMVPPPKK